MPFRSGFPSGPRGARYSSAASGAIPMAITTADTFVSPRRILFIEMILYPTIVFLLFTAALASERGERPGRFQQKPMQRPLFGARLANSAPPSVFARRIAPARALGKE